MLDLLEYTNGLEGVINTNLHCVILKVMKVGVPLEYHKSLYTNIAKMIERY